MAAAGDDEIDLFGIPPGIGGIFRLKRLLGIGLDALECKAVPGLQIKLAFFLKMGALAAVVNPYGCRGEMVNAAEGAVAGDGNALGDIALTVFSTKAHDL